MAAHPEAGRVPAMSLLILGGQSEPGGPGLQQSEQERASTREHSAVNN